MSHYLSDVQRYDTAAGDAVVAKVCETMKGDNRKSRVNFCYPVAKEMGKLGDL